MKTRARHPWTEALHYVMAQRHWRQADLIRATGMNQNTISRLWRGGHTTTRILTQLAKTLQIPLEDLLVSPTYRDKQERRRQLVAEIADRVLQETQRRSSAPTTARDRTDAGIEVLHDLLLAEERETPVNSDSPQPSVRRQKKNSAKATRKVS